tara:strand:+ start:2249 stop:2500 length:252 start_codon:yes stop_codon:yes gene_type:complete
MLKELFEKNKYLMFAGISTLSLVLTSISNISLSRSIKEISNNIEPISSWASTQNECIMKTFRIDGQNTQGIPSKVWSCNGGGQ